MDLKQEQNKDLKISYDREVGKKFTEIVEKASREIEKFEKNIIEN